MKKQYAVFDIDGVITRTSMLQLVVRELVARGYLESAPGAEVELMLHDYRQRVADGTFPEYMNKVTSRLFSAMPNGLRVDEYNEIINAVVKTSLNNTFVYTRELIATLKRNNFFLIAISGSELRAVSTISKSLGFDAWVGEATYVENDGKFTGEVQILTQSKAQILQKIIEKFDLETKGSTAVGDTSADIPVLEMVESPIVFNPNQDLYKKANEKGWMVVLERKDMVYGLSKEGQQYVLKQVNI